MKRNSSEHICLPPLSGPFTGKSTLEVLPKLQQGLSGDELQYIEEKSQELLAKARSIPWLDYVAGKKIDAGDEAARKIIFLRTFPSVTNRKQQGTHDQEVQHILWIMADIRIQDQVKRGLLPDLDFIMEINNIFGYSVRKEHLKSYLGFEPEDLHLYLTQLDAWIQALWATFPPIVAATALAAQLITVHPFSNANGRTSRLLLDGMLQLHRFPVCCFVDKFSALISRSDQNWDTPLFQAVQKVLLASENTLRVIEGMEPQAFEIQIKP